MKNKKRIGILAVLLVVLIGVVYFIYDKNKDRLFFKEEPTVEINTEFNNESIIDRIDDGTFKEVECNIKKLDMSKTGEYEVTYTYKDKDYTTTIKVVDTTKPEIKGIDSIEVYEGDKVDFKKDVIVEDNSKQECTLEIDDSSVNLKKAGSYTVSYKATDPSKNETTQKRGVVVKEKPKAPITINQSGNKVVYLTFDDGPSQNTRKILDILKKYNVKATFFVTGNGQRYNQYIKDAHNDGHTIALHTYCHDYKTIYSSTDAYFKDLNKLSDMVENLIGVRPKYIRFPGGSSNAVSRKYCPGIMTKLVGEVTAKGYRYYDWNVSSEDASGNNVPTARIIRASTSSNASNINLLCHDTDAKDTTVQALPSIIEHYQAKGYVFKAIDDTSFTPHHGLNN